MVLHTRGHQRAVQENQPREIHRQHEHRQQAHASAVRFNVPTFFHHHVRNIPCAGGVVELPQGARHQPAPERRAPGHACVGDELVQKSEPRHRKEQWHQRVHRPAHALQAFADGREMNPVCQRKRHDDAAGPEHQPWRKLQQLRIPHPAPPHRPQVIKGILQLHQHQQPEVYKHQHAQHAHLVELDLPGEVVAEPRDVTLKVLSDLQYLRVLFVSLAFGWQHAYDDLVDKLLHRPSGIGIYG